MNIFLPLIIFFEKIVAFLKQVLIAGYFGTTSYTDAYQIAENIISIIRGAFSNSIPIAFLTSLVQKKIIRHDWKQYSSKMVGTNTAISILVTFAFIIVGIVFYIFGKLHGYSQNENTSILLLFLLVLTPTIFLGLLSCLMGAQLEAEKIFWPVKILSIITSVSVIAFVFFLFNKLGLVSIFVGETFALIVHIILLGYILNKNNLLVAPKIVFKSEELTQIWKKSIPLMISSSVYSINSLVDKAVAVNIASGSATVLQYARVLTLDLFPMVVVTAYSGVIMRECAELVTLGEKDKISEYCEMVLQVMAGFLGVVVIVTRFCSVDIISIAFQRGAFDTKSVELTNAAMLGYVLGVVFLPFREVSSKVHFAYGDTKTPFISAMIGVALNIALSVLLSWKIGLIGIALATTSSIIVSGVINLVVLKRKRKVLITNHVGEWFKILIGLSIIYLLNYSCVKFNLYWNKYIHVIVVSVLSLAIYYSFTLVIKSKSSMAILGTIKNKVTL